MDGFTEGLEFVTVKSSYWLNVEGDVGGEKGFQVLGRSRRVIFLRMGVA